MDVTDRLDPVLTVAAAHASDVDKEARFPIEAVDALRASNLLGLTLPVSVGGLGGGPRDLVRVVSALAGACGSTAMIYLMHISAAMPLAAAPPPAFPNLLGDLATGRSLGSLAFSEAGSRSHFWAPVSQPSEDADGIRMIAKKSWVTSAGQADVYVVSTRSPDAAGVDLYAIQAHTEGVAIDRAWAGMGFRGNESCPMTFDLTLSPDQRIGPAAGGFDLMMGTVLPWFNLGNSAVSLGLARAAVEAAVRHTTGARLEHLDTSLSALPTIRAQLAKMSIDLAMAAAYLDQCADRVAEPQDDTPLHVLGSKAASNDAALRITDAAMRVCGGAAFSQQLQIDRYFRDARAGHVMAPTADALYDFYGRAITGHPLFDAPAAE
ncbi:Rv1679 family acyl-CoA dehydrogenase [Glaciibacter psychrotolerans]|uniref:Alkylation response protein AidB-like acyl-CoA dehydrogenase n=1 Tax=Glaciibacter psychrotolerans TaxID=670054 RepID=A0A7Z0EDC3_9MICO|nr:acyl-CoA dehydrogenase family protein [Leifsonia psychrotolerans]NYJ19090.1 alkylation response protein AidB-like acyl-CoA dehydrogenase [Leifsonia psychrotolerans]